MLGSEIGSVAALYVCRLHQGLQFQRFLIFPSPFLSYTFKIASLDFHTVPFYFSVPTFLVHVCKKRRPNKTTLSLSRIVAKLDTAGTDVHSKETRGYISELGLWVCMRLCVYGGCDRASARTRLGKRAEDTTDGTKIKHAQSIE